MLFVCDMHVHIGRAGNGQAVKVTASRELTFENIAKEAAERKGIDVVGIIDCASPAVIDDIDAMLDAGEMVELAGGGLRYLDKVTVILGSEVETREKPRGMSHHLSYFKTFADLRNFSETISPYITNLNLSSQACGMSARELFGITEGCDGIFVPAHCFTPHKSTYGVCTERMADMFGDAWPKIPAIELGLSADAFTADRIAELAEKTFLSNSDAHSLPKIGREYNIVEMVSASFEEFAKALWRQNGRHVVANFGLDSRLGKYNRTFCEECGHIALGNPPIFVCERCNGKKITRGVYDRICEIADYDEPQSPGHRAAYQYQVPLQFVPGVGAVALRKLLNRFGSEMAVLHSASREEIGQTVGEKVAELIIQGREGTLKLQAGGGGRYGRAVTKHTGQVRLPGV